MQTIVFSSIWNLKNVSQIKVSLRKGKKNIITKYPFFGGFFLNFIFSTKIYKSLTKQKMRGKEKQRFAQMEAEGKICERPRKKTRREVHVVINQLNWFVSCNDCFLSWKTSDFDLISVSQSIFRRQMLEKKKSNENKIKTAFSVKDHLANFPHFRHYRGNGLSLCLHLKLLFLQFFWYEIMV